MTDRPVFHRLLPSTGEDLPVSLNLREYPDALRNLTMDTTQMRFSKTVFDQGYRSDMEDYDHFYWVSVESGELTLSFESGALISVYSRDNQAKTASITTKEPSKPPFEVTLGPGDIIAMIDIRISAFNGNNGPTTILTCGWVNQDDPSPCNGGCWLP